MLQIKNQTPFRVMLLPLVDRDGVDTVYAIVKGTFNIGARVSLADEQQPITLVDQHFGEPTSSSIRAPSDVCLEKSGTDILMIGSAWAPDGNPLWQMDVSLSIGPNGRTVRVFGDRVWDGSGMSTTWIAPFTRMPLLWERAFGGRDETPAGLRSYAQNPVGMGFRSADGTKPLGGLPLPNVEDPRALIQSWKDAPLPAGFAPLAPHWEPRRSYAGTYDSAWETERAPYLPRDFDARFFQLAPSGMCVPQGLHGGELVEAQGVTPDGVLRFVLPAARIDLSFRLERGGADRQASLDMVLVEPDAHRLTMVWRAALRCDKAMLKVREVTTTVQRAA